MTEDFIPVQVIQENKKKVWQMDISKLSTIELIELKENLKDTTFGPTITMLDKLIHANSKSFNGVRGNMYMKELKKNSKIKNKTKYKSRRR